MSLRKPAPSSSGGPLRATGQRLRSTRSRGSGRIRTALTWPALYYLPKWLRSWPTNSAIPRSARGVLLPLSGRRPKHPGGRGKDVGAYLSSGVFLYQDGPRLSTRGSWPGCCPAVAAENRPRAWQAHSGGVHALRTGRVRIPLPPISTQREYGAAFQRLWDFARTLRDAHDMGIDFVLDIIDATAGPITEKDAAEQSPPSVRRQ